MNVKLSLLAAFFGLLVASDAVADERPNILWITVEDWSAANQTNYDFNKVGWPAFYPTRSIDVWEKARALWEPYIFRGLSEDVSGLNITEPKRERKKAE